MTVNSVAKTTGAFALAFGLITTSITPSIAGTASRMVPSAQPETTIFVGVPSEIEDIQVLLRRGDTRRAVDLARELVATVETSTVTQKSSTGSQVNRFLSVNALCVALAANGQASEAMQSCNRAVGMMPDHWEGYNSRGTAHFVSGNYRDALNDFRRAKELGTGSQDFQEIIDHNIQLAQARLN